MFCIRHGNLLHDDTILHVIYQSESEDAAKLCLASDIYYFTAEE